MTLVTYPRLTIKGGSEKTDQARPFPSPRGPVFFRQTRVGLDGRRFLIFKL